MNSATATSLNFSQGTPASARTAVKLLQKLRHGALTLQLPDGAVHRFGEHPHSQSANPQAHPAATLTVHNWNVFSAAMKSGDIGFAESFIAGDWSTNNLSDLLKVFILNRHEVEDVIYGTWGGRLLYRIRHLLNHNSKANSRKNIHAHYDLGNRFYEMWLDESMNYSSAWFDGDLTQPLTLAQNAKVRRALDTAQVKPGSRILEIGCGWGALAEMATTEFNASVVGVTLSAEQLSYAKQRLANKQVPIGAGKAAEFRLQDYRDIKDEPFDAICSIEMVEAVGRAYWPQYFETVNRLLKPGGAASIQSIVIHDALYERYLQSTDFIQQYIFPGGCLPCPSEFRRQAKAAGLVVANEFAFGTDYAETLRRWRNAFLARYSDITALGFDTRFMRIWEFYLCYCEAAFDSGDINLMQYTLLKPAQ